MENYTDSLYIGGGVIFWLLVWPLKYLFGYAK